MNVNPQHMEALKSIQRRVGEPIYSEPEARFLYLVATHSGYFIQRQYLTFRSQKYGAAVVSLVSKVLEKGHGRQRRYQGRGYVYHVFAQPVYTAIDQDSNPNRRAHQLEYLQAKLAALDFVLAHQECEYLETEEQKIAFFSRQMQLPLEDLPAKTFYGKRQSGPVTRYFPEGFPILLSRSDGEQPVATFTFIDAGRVGFGQYLTYLTSYEPLFKLLKAFRFIFASCEPNRFAAAGRHFSRLVLEPQKPLGGPAGLMRYFHLRAAREAKDYAKLTMDNIHFYADAERMYGSQKYQTLYRKWQIGEASEAEILGYGSQPCEPMEACFETFVLPSNRYIFRPQRVGEQKIAS